MSEASTYGHGRGVGFTLLAMWSGVGVFLTLSTFLMVQIT